MNHDFKVLADTSSERGHDFRRGRTENPIPDRITPAHAFVKSSNGSIEQLGTLLSFPRKAEIYYENQPADHLYKVISGTVRTYKSLSDGRRKIGAFYMPGDFFGLETGSHAFSAEAITEAKILAIKRDRVVTLAAGDNKVARRLWSLVSRELDRVHKHLILLVMSAEERVVGFLCEMADHFPTEEGIELPMSRQDIADYLGLTIETVSRTLTHLERAALIALPTSRRVVLHSRYALNQSVRETGSIVTKKPVASRPAD